MHLLAEFDGLLMGYAGPGRLRFCEPEQAALVWNAKNAVCAPMVLGGRPDRGPLEDGGYRSAGPAGGDDAAAARPLPEVTFERAVAALGELVLDLEVRDVRVARWPMGADSSRGA